MSITADDLMTIYEAGKRDLIAFRDIILTDPTKNNEYEFESAPFHYAWSDLLLNDNRNIAIEAFRESAKSQYIGRVYPLYVLTYPTKDTHYIIIVKDTQPKAQTALEQIRLEATNNPLIARKIIERKRESGSILDYVVMGTDNKLHTVRIEAYGKGTSLRGSAYGNVRPTIVLFDDIQSYDDVRSEQIRGDDKNRFASDIKFLGQSTRWFMIGNNLGSNCLIEYIRENAEPFNCAFIRQPIRDDDGQSTWQTKFSNEFIEKEEDNARRSGTLNSWICERLCLSNNDETRIFKNDDFRYYSRDLLPEILRTSTIFRMVDPSYKLKTATNDPDPRAIIVVAVSKDNYWYLIDGWFGIVTPLELIEKDFEFARKYKTNACGWEQLEIYKSFILEKQREYNTYYNLVELKPKGIQKEVRIKEKLQPRFGAHTILFPEMQFLTCDWLTKLIEQLETFPRSKHDDLLDALAYCEDIAYKPVDYNDISGLNSGSGNRNNFVAVSGYYGHGGY